MPKGYTTKARIENYLLINIDASFDTQIDDWIEEIETYIDHYTGRNFKADTAATQRVFDGDGSGSVLIDDAVAITALEIGSVAPLDTVPATDYLKYPANAQSLARPIPITKLQLVAGAFPCYPQVVKVTAKWGYSVNVPADIRNIATILVAGIVNYSNTSEGEIKSMTIGRYQVTYKDDKQWQDFERVDGILQSYVKHMF